MKQHSWDDILGEFEKSEEYKRVPVKTHYHSHLFDWLISNYFPPVKTGVIRVGDVSIEVENKTGFLRGERIYLTNKEFGILHLFLTLPHRIHSRDEILKAVWEDVIVSEKTVDVHIHKLRKKFQGAFRVETVKGLGYKLEVL